ncbi:signal peptide peptidase SppA [Thiolapillus brandeum]|uniref:Protease IV n=1 Tax=Thiolapillus brandeum TaxID=1076588 RepID=A0A7U6GHA4_9GAMM|nr:signal peptide peptidase SppA [Thiolapillus brandeum]BAO43573.1 protease IV [Thiolapillus brandeum]
MKSFLKTAMASLVGLVLFLVLLVMLAGVIITSQEAPKPLEDNTLLVVNLSVPISDKAPRQKFSDVIGGAIRKKDAGQQSLRTLVRAIHKAAGNDHISALYLKGNVVRKGYASGWAALKEVREAVAAFRDAGKPVITWQEDLDEETLYVVSPANEIVLNPMALMEFNGFAAEVKYYRQAFEKYGIDVQVTRVGKYKSAVEPFLLDHMSDESREQLNSLLNDMFDEAVADIARSRKLSPDSLYSLAQNEAVIPAREALSRGFVTSVDYYDVVLKRLRELTDTKAGEEIERLVGVSDFLASVEKESEDKDKLVVIYAEGDIVSGNDEDEVAGTYISRLLRKAREDDDVKAVVLRVNSPGGSADASDIIQRETILLKKEKPLIVSMGTVAASGGYWISAYGDEIYAEPNTITGSIGVFGMYLNIKKLVNEFGVKVETARTAPAADIYSLFRPKTERELAVIQKFVDSIYDQFLDKVSEGRKLDRAAVHEIAQGRVWSGKQARQLGLVDKFGGLEDAIAAAADKAGLKDYRVEEYQQPGSFMDDIMEELGFSASVKTGVPLLDSMWEELGYLLQKADSKGIYVRLPYDLSVH